MEFSEIIENLNQRSREAFREGERIRSFGSYLRDLTEDTYHYTRSAAQYVRDMFHHYGSEKRKALGSDITRHLLFDAPFDDGKDQVFGQETVQHSIYGHVSNFAQEGTANRLILLHGPNGSSKTSVIRMILRGMEHYSRQPEGVLYAFSWIFPKKEVSAGTLGFGPQDHNMAPREDSELPSFAYLSSQETATRMICEQKDAPFFLLPLAERQRLLEEAHESGGFPDESPRHLLEGMLCQKCKSIYENLLNSYQGDWLKVVQHIRVERIFISQRYRSGAVTVEPQMHVDAGIRQLTMDTSLAELPASLQNLPLFQTYGDLVDANPGVIEYSDLLKRPIEMNRYLLGTTEKSTLNLECAAVYLNVVMMGTSNEKQLDAFKQTPDFTSFRGRLAFVQTPYILEANKEAMIYGPLLETIRRRRHIAPHVAEVTGLWATLTRMRRPDPDNYPAPMRAIISRLTPMQKALLYDRSQAPEDLRESDRKLLVSWIPKIREEWREDINYEGRYGASPREMKVVIAQAGEREGNPCLNPLAVFEGFRALVKEKTLYDFLRLEPAGGYHDNDRFISDVEAEYLKWVTGEIRDSMQLVDEEEYDRRFGEYLQNVMAYNKKEKVRHPATGEMVEPDPEVMTGVEKLLNLKEDVDTYRQNLVAKVGAFVVDHPGEPLSYRDLFPEILGALKREFYHERETVIRRIQEDLMRHGTEEFPSLPEENRQQVETTLEKMREVYKYCERCAKDVILYVLRKETVPGITE